MRKLGLIVITLVFILSLSITAFAGAWEQKAEGWKWKLDDGTYAKNGWQWIDSNSDGVAECYYFDDRGICLQATTTPDGYTVNADGAWIKDGVVQTKRTSVPVRANIIINTDQYDTSTSLPSVNRYAVIYAHVLLQGPKGTSQKLRAVAEWPEGDTSTISWDDRISVGDNSYWGSFWSDDPARAATGTLRISIYTEDGTKIGEQTVQITK